MTFFVAIPFICVGIFIIVIFIFVIIYTIRQSKSIIERAKKIDPSVKTISEAQYVLQKDMYQNFGSKKDNENK
ncbi:MAG: hypothetical protein VZS44_06270 [Bacilli bacterium]|nr:hypothetical protein [Bacilli bacterium]